MMAQTHLLAGYRNSVNSTVGFAPTTSSSTRTYLFTPAPGPRETWLLIGPIAQGWTLNRHLTIVIEVDDDGTFLASDDEFAVYGEGSNREQAARDYVVSLIEVFPVARVASKTAHRDGDALQSSPFRLDQNRIGESPAHAVGDLGFESLNQSSDPRCP